MKILEAFVGIVALWFMYYLARVISMTSTFDNLTHKHVYMWFLLAITGRSSQHMRQEFIPIVVLNLTTAKFKLLVPYCST